MHRSPNQLIVLAILTALPLTAQAEVLINEIMYDLSGTDTSREWIEVYNSGSTEVDLSTWKLFEGNSNHSLNNISGGASVSAGGYAIIADNSTKFLEDRPSYAGALFDSAFSLNNTGEALVLRNADLVDEDAVTYSSSVGANGDGNSLQRNSSGTWVAAAPTPGAANEGVSDATTTPETDEEQEESASESATNESTHYSAAWLSHAKSGEKFEIGAGRDRVSIVGMPIEFKAEVNFGYAKNSYFQWSFGDGSLAYGPAAVHTYEYPGEYAVVLNVTIPEDQVAVSRLNVRVYAPKLSITHASPERIEVSNDGEVEANLYGRAITASGGVFIFPQDTIVRPGQKISFPAHVTHLAPSYLQDAILIIVGTQPKVHEITATIEKERQEKIVLITEEISVLKQALAAMPPPQAESDTVVEDFPPQIDESAVETAAVINSIPEEVTGKSWFSTIRKFFLRSK